MSKWTPRVLYTASRRLSPGFCSWGTFPSLVLTLPLPHRPGMQSPGLGQSWAPCLER